MSNFTFIVLSSVLLSTATIASNMAPVISGGVGEESQQAIEQAEKTYNTKLVFTGVGGIYLANVAVTIRDKSGEELVNGVSDGPFLLTDLKPGRYTVEAEADGFTQKRNIVVGSKLKTYQITFPIKDEAKVSFLSPPNDISHPEI